MKERVHFYSTYDMSIPINIERADMVIEKYKQGWRQFCLLYKAKG